MIITNGYLRALKISMIFLARDETHKLTIYFVQYMHDDTFLYDQTHNQSFDWINNLIDGVSPYSIKFNLSNNFGVYER